MDMLEKESNNSQRKAISNNIRDQLPKFIETLSKTTQ